MNAAQAQARGTEGASTSSATYKLSEVRELAAIERSRSAERATREPLSRHREPATGES